MSQDRFEELSPEGERRREEMLRELRNVFQTTRRRRQVIHRSAWGAIPALVAAAFLLGRIPPAAEPIPPESAAASADSASSTLPACWSVVRDRRISPSQLLGDEELVEKLAEMKKPHGFIRVKDKFLLLPKG